MTDECHHVCSCLTVYGGRAWNHVDAPAPTAMNARVVTGHAAPDASNHARLPTWSITRPRGDPAWDCRGPVQQRVSDERCFGTNSWEG